LKPPAPLVQSIELGPLPMRGDCAIHRECVADLQSLRQAQNNGRGDLLGPARRAIGWSVKDFLDGLGYAATLGPSSVRQMALI
jgi:hypothetical protein